MVLNWLRPRRRYHFSDVLRFFALLGIHYAFYILYAALVLSLRLAIKQDTFLPPTILSSGYWYYPFAAPLISASLHAAYAEIGSPTIRFLMWLHTVFGYVYLPVIALV